MADAVNLKVNGTMHTLDIDPDTPLLYPLRNNLKLNGPKYGCGIERCGSCMVLLDGKAMPSCRIPCREASQYNISTLESLGNAQSPHPVQQAFMDEQAAQCGYCLNGMIMCAKALLDENANPSDTEIRQALQRVLCRCGTHSGMIKAVKNAANKLKK